jgi:membrane protein required for colicin V production
MSWLDIILIIILIIPTLIGLKIGIIKALLSLVGIVVGVVLAGRYSGSLAEVLPFISDSGWAKIAAFAIIVIVVMIIASVLAAVIKWFASAILLGWVNRLGGAVLGFIVGAVFCGALLTMWVKFLGIGDAVSGSALANILLDGFPIVLALLPAEFDSVRSFFQ